MFQEINRTAQDRGIHNYNLSFINTGRQCRVVWTEVETVVRLVQHRIEVEKVARSGQHRREVNKKKWPEQDSTGER